MKDYKYQQVYKTIIKDIEEGYLQYHDKIPSVRKMAKDLNISRTTVESAYDQLLVEGYIYAKKKVGYFVDVQEAASLAKEEFLYDDIQFDSHEYRYDFSGRKVDDESFNFDTWKKYIKRALSDSHALMCYGEPLGEPILKKALQKYSLEHRGVRRVASQYVIGAGFQTLLYHICGLFSKETVVAMEEGGFKQAEAVFADCHMLVKKLPVDSQGISIAALQNSNIQVLYLNSSSGGYHGHPIKRQRRNEILQYARSHGVYIIEDDHNGELKFNTKPIDAMARDDNQWIIYIGSFSKLLLPSIRISYMALPVTLMQPYKKYAQYYHQTASKLEQIALAYYIEDGQLSRHLKRLRKHYASKGKYMLMRLQEAFSQYHFELYETPLKITMTLPKEKVTEYIEIARKNDILVNQNSNQQITLSFSGILQKDIDDAIALLKKIWK